MSQAATSSHVETDGFEHLNNFLLLNEGRDVLVKHIPDREPLASNLVQCTTTPLSPTCTYYTMTVKRIQEGNFIMFGLTNKCLPGAPMWTVDRSVRYHSNDGGVFNGSKGIRTYHPYSEGDTVKCRLDYAGPDRSLINFLHNDRFVFRQWVNLPPDQLYATIGVSRGDAEFTVDWPSPDKGDLIIRSDLLSNWFGWKGIQRDDETSTFTMASIDDTSAREAFNVQCPLAFSKDFSYFEIEVVKKIPDGKGQGIGLVSGNCEVFVYPGWTPQSIGYHNDDGGLYVNGEESLTKKNDELKCQEQDRMGCGVIFPRDLSRADLREPVLVLVYFTKNGDLVYTKRMRQPRGGFFPCISAFCKDDKVKLDVKCKPPVFAEHLYEALTLCESSTEYRCNEMFRLSDIRQHSVTIRLEAQTDSAHLIQYRAEPLRNVGDSFQIHVTNFGDSTEIQMGVSAGSFQLEGAFLGSEPSSCGYMLKLGTIVSKDGMRPVAKWHPDQDQTFACYLDYIDDSGAVLCFTIDDHLIGRGVIARATGCSTALYASIVMSAGPAEVKADWNGILNSTRISREQKSSEEWLRPSCIRANGWKLQLIPDGYFFAASAQSCLPLVTGSSIFSVRMLDGEEWPGIGLSRATTDVNNVLGSDFGEICFLPSTKHILANNIKKNVSMTPEICEGDTLQCGVVFSRPADRVPQKVVVIFAVNNVIFHHCRMQISYGGLYPTIAFPSTGGCVEIHASKTILPIPDSISNSWLVENADNNDDCVTEKYTEPPPNAHQGINSGRFGNLVYQPVMVKTVSVFASHAFDDRDKVGDIIAELKKTQPLAKVEMSASHPNLQDKFGLISASDMVVMFVSKEYFCSQEMKIEFAFIDKQRRKKKGIKNFLNGLYVVLCTMDGTGWPPTDLFGDETPNLSRLPKVHVAVGDHGKPNTAPLERLLDNIFEKKTTDCFYNGDQIPTKRQTPKTRVNLDPERNTSGSTTCIIV